MLMLSSCFEQKKPEVTEFPSIETPGDTIPNPTPVPDDTYSLKMNYPTSTTGYQARPKFEAKAYMNYGSEHYLYAGANCDSLIGTIVNNVYGTSIIWQIQINLPGTYRFSTNAKDGLTHWYSTCSPTPITYTLLAPPAPTAVALSASTPSPGFTSPKIVVAGVPGSHLAKIYSDSQCLTEVGSATANDSISMTNLSVDSNVASSGNYNFYAKIFNEAGVASTCSTNYVTYTLTSPPQPTSLSMLAPASSSGYDPTPMIQINFASSFSNLTVKLYTDATCSTEVGTGTLFSNWTTITTSTLSVGSYTFYSKTFAGASEGSCSTAHVGYDLLPLTAPTSISLVSPLSSPHYVTTPTVSISGVMNQDTVKIYSDNSCTTQIGQGSANSTTINIDVSQILNLGTTTFYAKRTNASGLSSVCSSGLLSYTRNIKLNIAKHSDFTTGSYPVSAVLYDYDSNSTMDLVVASNQSFSLNLLPGLGNGLFGTRTNITGQNNMVSVLNTDVDHDGKMDLMTAAGSPSSIRVHFGNGNGTFQTAVSTPNPLYNLNDAVFEDFNSDGQKDAALIGGTSLYIYLGQANGTFGAATVYTIPYDSRSLKSVDVNNDSKKDLIIGNYSTLSVLLGNGDGTFAPAVQYTITNSYAHVRTADFNKDGFIDIALYFYHDTLEILLNDGSGNFSNRSIIATGLMYQEGLNIYDIDADGNDDIILGGRASNMEYHAKIYFGKGDGTLDFPLSVKLTDSPMTFLVHDMNADGKLDFISLGQFGNGEIFLGQ